jgi:hypothetical protein
MQSVIQAEVRKKGRIWQEQFFTLYLYSYILIVGMAGLKIEA